MELLLLPPPPLIAEAEEEEVVAAAPLPLTPAEERVGEAEFAVAARGNVRFA